MPTAPPPRTAQPRVTNLPALVASIELLPQAQERADEYIADFADSLPLQSKTSALTQKANVVLSTHVDQAQEIITSRAHKHGRLREFLLIAGSAMIGTFLQGFPTEMSAEPIRRNIIIFNVCMGVLGVGLVSWGLVRKL